MSISKNLENLQARIAAACRDSGRDPDDVTLIAVSKTKPAADVTTAAALGLQHFGENYVDEAVTKIQCVNQPALTWHFIGRVQSNKTRAIAAQFDWVHTVERSKIARRLDTHRAGHAPLSVLVQINADADPNKAGVPPEAAMALVEEILPLPNLQLRGLMTILSRDTDPGAGYQSVAQLFRDIKAALEPPYRSHWDTLSMGMTADLEQAIAAGATQVRIGTALFGARSVNRQSAPTKT